MKEIEKNAQKQVDNIMKKIKKGYKKWPMTYIGDYPKKKKKV